MRDPLRIRSKRLIIPDRHLIVPARRRLPDGRIASPFVLRRIFPVHYPIIKPEVATISRVSGQNNSAVVGGFVSSLAVTLTNNPTTGNLVVASMADASGISNTGVTWSISDANSNNYAATTHTPSAAADLGVVGIWYLKNAPANASKTITVSWTGATRNGVALFVGEYAGARIDTSVFDQDAFDGAGGHTGTVVNTPQITPANANELIVFVSIVGGGATVAAGTGWSLIGTVFSSILAAADQIQTTATLTPATATGALTQGASGNWDSLIAAFTAADALQGSQDIFMM